MLAQPPLRAALDALYAALAVYSRPNKWEAAQGRPTNLLQRLGGAPLRELTCAVLGSYSGWAMTTVGEPRHYKHFLPRIAELAVQGDCPHLGTSPPALASKIIYAGFARWPDLEQQAIRAVFRAAFEQAVTEHPDFVDAEEWLCADLHLGTDISEALQIWAAAPQPNATLQLAASVQSATHRDGDTEPPPFWEGLPASYRPTFDAWLLRPAARANLEAAMSGAGQDEWLVNEALTAKPLQ
jgi:hypothetical protein